MFGIISAVVLLICGIIGFCINRHTHKKAASLILVVAIILAGCVIGLSSFTTVPTGHTGVVTSFGRVEEYTLESGVHFIAPWKNVVKMDNRVQKNTVTLSSFSSDIQEVTIVYTLNYQISKVNASVLYRTIGVDYYDKIIVPSIAECVKTATAKYTAEELVNERNALATSIEDMLSEQLALQNIEVVTTAVEDLDFTDAFTTAVEQKQVAQQNKLRAETEQAQKTAEEQAAADRAIIAAEAEAEVARIQAEAEAEVVRIQADAARYAGEQEAEANKAIAASLTQDIIDYYYIQQWDGVLPSTYVGSEDVNTIIAN